MTEIQKEKKTINKSYSTQAETRKQYLRLIILRSDIIIKYCASFLSAVSIQ